MEHDPWSDAFKDASPSDSQSDADTNLEPLDQFRKQLGLPYNAAAEAPAYTELGEAYGDDEPLKAALQTAACAFLGRKPTVAYNPGSGEHVTLARAFPGSRVIFADVSGYIEHAFVQHGIKYPAERYEFYRADMHDFRLPSGLRADITLILNAGYMTEDELNSITTLDGLVIVNDWHDAAQYMQQRCPGYPLRTRITMDQPENDLYVFQRQSATPHARLS
jgi:hypothetical protein